MKMINDSPAHRTHTDRCLSHQEFEDDDLVAYRFMNPLLPDIRIEAFINARKNFDNPSHELEVCKVEVNV